MPFTSTKLLMDQFFAGMLADLTDHETDSYVNAEASQEMPFGTMLVQGTLDYDAKIAAAAANKLVGVLRHSQNYARLSAGGGELGTTGLIPKTQLGVLRRGKIVVVVSEAVTPSSAVRLNMDTNAGALGAVNGPGTFCTTASAGHTLDVSKFCQFRGTTTGSGLVVVQINMAMRNLAVAD